MSLCVNCSSLFLSFSLSLSGEMRHLGFRNKSTQIMEKHKLKKSVFTSTLEAAQFEGGIPCQVMNVLIEPRSIFTDYES